MTSARWYCKGCGSAHELDMTSGGMELAAQGLPVAGGVTCEKCMTRHEIADIVAGKFSTPRPKAKSEFADTKTEIPALIPSIRIMLGALGFLFEVINDVLHWVWSALGTDYVPQWFVLQVVDQGLSLAIMRVLALILVGIGLTATHVLRPQLWYLAGVIAFFLSIRVAAFWFLGDDTLFGGATTLWENLIVWFLYGIRWLPLYPIMVFLLAVGALQLEAEIGTFISKTIFWVGSVYCVTVLMSVFGIPLSLYTDFPVVRIAAIIYQTFCVVVLYRLSRT